VVVGRFAGRVGVAKIFRVRLDRFHAPITEYDQVLVEFEGGERHWFFGGELCVPETGNIVSRQYLSTGTSNMQEGRLFGKGVRHAAR
jgi:hypothetical protein